MSDLKPERLHIELERRYGLSEALFVLAFMKSVAETYDHEYVDNVRFARVGDKAEEEVYEDQKRRGCCGYYDDEIGPSPAGHHYAWGFNYGH